MASGRHCSNRVPRKEADEPVAPETHHRDFGLLRRCPKAGHLYYGPVCRTCRVSIKRRRLFHVVEFAEPLESRLEPAEAARMLDTLSMARGKIRRDRPRPQVYKSPRFKFWLAGYYGLPFRMELHPPITIVVSPESSRVEGPESRVES